MICENTKQLHGSTTKSHVPVRERIAYGNEMNGSNLQTPRRLGAPRPSFAGGINTASSPNLSAAAAVARKASLQALTGAGSGKMGGGGDIQVGDTVDVPGGMHGTAKFIGSIDGKSGTFLGVELAKQYAHKGKNDGDVDG